tara:strand:- start:1975 stop:2604 length:630 start_codon:yes stop_codon:yes gene_type:complete
VAKIKIRTADVVTFAVVFILVSSVFGLFVYRQDSSSQLPDNAFTYKDVTFYEQSDGFFGVYLLRADGQVQPVSFRLDPREMDQIEIHNERMTTRISNADKIYTVFNPNLDINYGKVAVAIGEVARLLPLTTKNQVVSTDAYIEDSEPINPDVPVRNCDNIPAGVIIIVFEIGDENKIGGSGKCLKVEGTNEDNLIKAADRLGYMLVGIV